MQNRPRSGPNHSLIKITKFLISDSKQTVAGFRGGSRVLTLIAISFLHENFKFNKPFIRSKIHFPFLAGYVNSCSSSHPLKSRAFEFTCIKPAVTCCNSPRVIVIVFKANKSCVSKIFAKCILIFVRKT